MTGSCIQNQEIPGNNRINKTDCPLQEKCQENFQKKKNVIATYHKQNLKEDILSRFLSNKLWKLKLQKKNQLYCGKF